VSNHYALILCGGSGTRLWPLSRTLRPKQLLALNGKETLLQQTAKRLLAHVPAENLYTVTHEDHKFEVKGQLAEVAPEAISNVLFEPCARNTLPAIAWAVDQIQQSDKDAIIGVFASEHKIGYIYLLTPEGIKTKSLMTIDFLGRKLEEYEALQDEINVLKQELDIDKSYAEDLKLRSDNGHYQPQGPGAPK